ncbi:hypothetical protein C8034_v010224 [Colletotrichum sidae]|uniref:Uncharacterized protein n=1 Tax=Colletotrichum sidae TaxID=1347389 RepID=A0A4R8T1F9_9PEZI|nr:hypothetical protein C8034_v010224 [Colletotrichum sidae]
MKAINNYKNYNYFYKTLNKLVIYESNFIIFSSFLEITIIKFSFKILLIDKTTSITKKYKSKKVKKNLISKNEIFSNKSKYFKYILEITY